jgi:hypothetical protein
MATGTAGRKPRRLPFVIAGIVLGTLVNGFYLYRINLLGSSLFGVPAHDPPWNQFVNVFLIYAVFILQMNLLGRGIFWLSGLRERKRR